MLISGKELEAAGVLVGAQQKFEDKGLWNLQGPFVAPDGALVPYAWKRQIAGQAAASAYDRARYFYIERIFPFTFQETSVIPSHLVAIVAFYVVEYLFILLCSIL